MVKIIKQFGLPLILLVLFHWLLVNFTLTSTAKINLVVNSSQDTGLTVYYSTPFKSSSFTERQSFSSTPIQAGVTTKVTLHTKNRLISHLRIDPFPDEGRIKIYSMEMLSHFGDPIVLGPVALYNNARGSEHTALSLNEGYLEVVSGGLDPQIFFENPVRFKSSMFGYLLPIFLAIIGTIIVKNISIKDIYAIRDIDQKKSSFQQKIISLDGLRGFAALLVLADHTGGPYLKGLGAMGVWIFFCLSGFLLSIPFVRNPSLITSAPYLQQYMFRRIKRILPMYYFILVVVYLYRARLETFVRHVLFVQGDGVFWSIPQEMFFYMILPLVFIFNFYICRGNIKVMAIATLVMSLLFHQFLTSDFIYIYGNGKRVPLLVGTFLAGIFLSYFYHSPYVAIVEKRSNLFHNVCGILLLGIVLLSSDAFQENFRYNYAWRYTGLYGYIAMLLLLFTVVSEKSLLNRLMSLYPLRAIGIVGFSFYLLHWTVLDVIRSLVTFTTGTEIGPVALLLSGTLITYFFSVITYSLIERPFITKSVSSGSDVRVPQQ
jgi:peptidoglycan/LPS O-acetylase OafA/YrhL